MSNVTALSTSTANPERNKAQNKVFRIILPRVVAGLLVELKTAEASDRRLLARCVEKAEKTVLRSLDSVEQTGNFQALLVGPLSEEVLESRIVSYFLMAKTLENQAVSRSLAARLADLVGILKQRPELEEIFELLKLKGLVSDEDRTKVMALTETNQDD